MSQSSATFGYRDVDPSEKPGLVRGVFDRVAGRYDLMNDLMSAGVHRLWKDAVAADAYSITFGIRNVTDVSAALREARRVLKPGGRFICLEFSRPTNSLIRAAYDAWSFNAIPRIGEWVANDRDSYQYLVESIRRFPDQKTFARMITDAGFAGAGYVNFTNGVAAMHTGRAV
jgi:ubiquinone/menaquinone biosynthesis C-methylase UbiE